MAEIFADLTVEAAAASPRTDAFGERLRKAFAQACARHRLDAALAGPAHRLEVRFADQDGVGGPRILQAFVEELEARGVRAAATLSPAALDDAQTARLEHVFADVASRLRTLLIEANSYLSGGLPWPFPDGDAMLRARGLAVYRFPAKGPVDVEPAGEGMRIAFAPGPLGEVTSSGFYVPTKVRGDFEVTLRYELARWAPGPVAACLALFAQDEPSLQRYYAQIRSAHGQQRHAMANLCERLSDTVPARGARGAFRLLRRGQAVSAWHRDADAPDWTGLGERADLPAHDMVIGSKIWSSERSDGLEALLTGLRIDGEIPADNLAAVPVRADPRRA
jgi:hypothetical protein